MIDPTSRELNQQCEPAHKLFNPMSERSETFGNEKTWCDVIDRLTADIKAHIIHPSVGRIRDLETKLTVRDREVANLNASNVTLADNLGRLQDHSRKQDEALESLTKQIEDARKDTQRMERMAERIGIVKCERDAGDEPCLEYWDNGRDVSHSLREAVDAYLNRKK